MRYFDRISDLSGISGISGISGQPITPDDMALLALLERVNPSDQRYYRIEDALVVTYQHRLNLLTFSKRLRLSVPVRIVGLPISLERSGIFGPESALSPLLEALKGLTLVLNADAPMKGGGQTLPTYVFDQGFSDFDHYLLALRSPYRRRVLKALERGQSLEITALAPSDFSQTHYALYQSVWERSPYPLECLPMAFFREMPAEFYQFKAPSGETLGFVQLLQQGDALLFMFCGFHQSAQDPYDLYYNMLLWIVKEGIRRGLKRIHFGQTSGESKMKIGCRPVAKHLLLHHSSPIVNRCLKALTPHMTYKDTYPHYRVFKEDIEG